jgi:hypothetical protein
MHEYAFDAVMRVSGFRIKAHSLREAVVKLNELLDCCDANLGAYENGDPILAEASLKTAITTDDCYEMDSGECCVCPECAAVEGEPEWGTVGDGFDGYCPSCADKREETGEVEIG